MNVAMILKEKGACGEATLWVGNRKGTPKQLWEECERGDWLLWIAARLGVKREIVVFAACQCARLALKHTKDPRVLACIETTEAWTRGEKTPDEVRAAKSAAAAAAYAAYAYADAANAAAAAAANAAAAAAAYDADAAYAAYAADAADAAYAAYAARSLTQKECAKLVRKHIPWSLVSKALKA